MRELFKWSSPLIHANVRLVDITEKVKATIARETLIPDGIRIVAGVSGGADSVALLHILHRLEIPLTVAHLNHSIRGAEADTDEAFVKNLCEKLGVECVTAKTNVPALAKEKGISLEMAAREARHEFFNTFGDVRIALAHHADDQLETFFLRAARGSGPAGLGGMKSFQCLGKLTLVRPMLGIRKNEIFQWLEKNKGAGSRRRQGYGGQAACFQWLEKEGIEWREDATNTDESIPRNRVRHQILPTLGKINERAAENILRTMEILRADEETQVARTAARDQLIEFGVSPTFDAIEQLIEFSGRTDGTSFLDLEGIRLVNEYGTVGRAVPSEPKTVEMKEGVGILRGRWEASVSLEKIAGRDVTVRTAEPGDRMNPYGMNGSKKLQDVFTDLKIPKAQRAEWPVVICGDEIIWFPGYRIARGLELSGDAEPALHLSASEIATKA